MAKKVYAVRKGLQTGIFNSWDECQESIKGYSGAEFKGFSSEDDAVRWLRGEEIGGSNTTPKEKVVISRPVFDAECNVFTDGSYKDGFASFGIYIQTNRADLKFSGAVDCSGLYGNMNNILGEVLAVYVALELVRDMNINKVNLYYDYEGVHSWASGAWRCNGELQSHYSLYVQNLLNSGALKINFKHVKGHSGVQGNVIADNLAKHGRERGKILDVRDIINGRVTTQSVHLAH